MSKKIGLLTSMITQTHLNIEFHLIIINLNLILVKLKQTRL